MQSASIPLGFALLASFSAGMIAIALLEALPSFFKTLEIRAKNKRIKQLEKELTLVRQMMTEQKKEDVGNQQTINENSKNSVLNI